MGRRGGDIIRIRNELDGSIWRGAKATQDQIGYEVTFAQRAAELRLHIGSSTGDMGAKCVKRVYGMAPNSKTGLERICLASPLFDHGHHLCRAR